MILLLLALSYPEADYQQRIQNLELALNCVVIATFATKPHRLAIFGLQIPKLGRPEDSYSVKD